MKPADAQSERAFPIWLIPLGALLVLTLVLFLFASILL